VVQLAAIYFELGTVLISTFIHFPSAVRSTEHEYLSKSKSLGQFFYLSKSKSSVEKNYLSKSKK